MEKRGKIAYWSSMTIIGLIIYLLLYFNGYNDVNLQIAVWFTFFMISFYIYLMLDGKLTDVLIPVRVVGKGLSHVSSKLGKSGLNWLNRQKISDYKMKLKLPKYDMEKKELISPGVEIRKKIDPPKEIESVKVKETFIGADSSEVYGGVRTRIGNIEADAALSSKDIVRVDNVKKTKKKKK
jgi:hypothetical protein